MNIAAILHEHAKTIGDRTAIVERNQRITFAELGRASARCASRLSGKGVRPSMRVLVLSPISIDLYVTVIALFHLRATVVFADPSCLSPAVDRVRPDAFAAVPRAHLLRITSAAVRSIPLKLFIDRWTVLVAQDSTVERRPESCEPDAAALITFTSGTTGEAKAAVRTHGFLLAQHRAIVDQLDLQPGEVDLTTLPVFLLANLASGVTSIVPDADLRNPGAIDPDPVLDQIRRERPTRTVASPALLEQLTSAAMRRGEYLPFRKIFTGGAPVFPKTLHWLARAAPDASVVAVYGSTEAEPIATIDRRELTPPDRRAMAHGAGLLAGFPSPALSVSVLEDCWGRSLSYQDPSEFARAIVPTGHPGEIAVSGEHVLAGYLDGIGDEETKIRVGDRVWHRTGDAGYFDGSGRLWLLGRCSAKVSDEAGSLYPLAVECAASSVPGIRRSAFIRHKGRRVLVVEPDMSGAPSRDTLLRRLSWAGIHDVLTLPSIPVDRRHNAEVDVHALQKALAQASRHTLLARHA